MPFLKNIDPNSTAMAQAVREQRGKWKHFVAGQNLDNTTFVYVSNVSEEAAIKEMMEAHPLAKVVQRVEYLSPQDVAKIRALSKDPVTQAVRSLTK